MDSARGVGIQLPRQSTLLAIAGQKQRTTMVTFSLQARPDGQRSVEASRSSRARCTACGVNVVGNTSMVLRRRAGEEGPSTLKRENGFRTSTFP